MAYKGALMVDDETLFKTMEVAAETDALVMVHAENGDAIDVLVKKALAEGKTEPRYHALTRPPETEGEATNRAIQLARVAGCALYVVHVSCKESVEPIMLAREKGWDVWGETCTQYFFVDYTFLERPDFEGAKFVYTPPPRDKANQDVLWDAVRRDTLSAISTDHCAFLWDGQKTLGKDDFSKIPNGGPGLENRLHMIHHFGVREGRIGLNRMVELLCTNPAKLFGLYPRKGTIAVGSDADIVVFDPEKRHADHRRGPAVEDRLQPLRGHRGRRRRRHGAPARQRDRRRRRGRGEAGHRPVRAAGALRRAAARRGAGGGRLVGRLEALAVAALAALSPWRRWTPSAAATPRPAASRKRWPTAQSSSRSSGSSASRASSSLIRDGCREERLALPSLERSEGSSACRPQGTSSPDGRFTARCADEGVEVSFGATGARLGVMPGCTPAWRPDGMLTAARGDEIVGYRMCGQPARAR